MKFKLITGALTLLLLVWILTLPSIYHPFSHSSYEAQHDKKVEQAFTALLKERIKPLYAYLTDSLQADNRKMDTIKGKLDPATKARYNRNLDLSLQLLWYQQIVTDSNIQAGKEAIQILRGN